jgi:3-dehydroquinate synthase
MALIELSKLGGSFKMRIGDSLDDFRRYVPENTVIISDENVSSIYGHRWDGFPAIIIGAGEKIKTLDTVHAVYSQLMSYGIDRSGFVVGIGGGIVCDIAGFAASTYLRGIRFGFVPTTLLAQCDAAIGGKNGVNFEGFKNMIGTFNHPEFVLCDPKFLQTLPAIELTNGFAEVVKHALIANFHFFDWIEKNASGMMHLEPKVMTHLIERSAHIKTAVVSNDEKEKGERRKLNFGHTFGHAIEKVTGLSHGQAVSVGMSVASAISLQKGYINSKQYERIKMLLKALGLPVTMVAHRQAVIDAMFMDKKRQEDYIHFVLLKDIGSAIIEKMSLSDISGFIGRDDIF